jgi:hypothetical protein
MIEVQEPPQIKRPIGVSILVVLLGLYAALMLLSVIWCLLHPQGVHSWLMTTRNPTERALNIVVYAPLKAAFAIVVAYNLWTLQNWARNGALVLAGIIFYSQLWTLFDVLMYLLMGVRVHVHVGAGALTVLIAFLAVVMYLSSSGVRRAFRLAAEARAPDYRSRQNNGQRWYTGS